MTENEKNAKRLINAIKGFTDKPEALDNFESYLSQHFEVWYKKYAGTAEGLIHELESFSNMYN